jgi:hypothetical protein
LLVLLKDFFNLRKVSLDDVCHVSEVFEEVGDFFFELAAKGLLYFRLHWIDELLDFVLIRTILRYEGALELHDCLHYELKLVNFGLFLLRRDAVVFNDLRDYLIDHPERLR